MTQLGDGGWVVSTRTVIGDGEFSRGGQGDDLEGAFGVLPEVGIVWKVPLLPIRVGAAVLPVAAQRAEWGFFDVAGGLSGANYGGVSQNSDFLAIELTASVSWEISEQWSLGASAGANYSRVGFDAPFIFQRNSTWAGAKIDLDMETDGWALVFDFGVLYQPHEDWSFGLHFQPPTVLRNEGKAEADFSAQLDALGVDFGDTTDRYDARTRNELPLTLAFGAAWQATERLKLGGRVDWIRWSQSFDTLEVTLEDGTNDELAQAFGARLDDSVPLDWEDRFVFSLGADYAVTDNWSLQAGWRYGKSPLPENLVTPLNGSILEHAVTLGVGYQYEGWRWSAGYSYEFSGTERVGFSGYRAKEFSDSSLKTSVHSIGLSVGRLF
jgi:long-chain fatty acid transport protein